MSGRLIDGEWHNKRDWETEGGAFERQESVFRKQVEAGSEHEPEAGRYHLYVSYACPWAHRTLMARALLGLQDAIDVSVVHHHMGEDGWVFRPEDDPDSTVDAIHGHPFLRQVYLEADRSFTGRVTVPVLWDKKKQTIVNNESREILRMFATTMAPLGHGDLNLSPETLRAEIDAMIDANYNTVNNGVYRCGFAGTQEAYEEAFGELFTRLGELEEHLATRTFLVGERLTEADICLFTTLVRFDPVYYVHFKCNGGLIADSPNLRRYVQRIHQLPGIAETVNVHHIKHHYYGSHEQLNPKGFVPVGPDVSWYGERG